MLSRWVMLGIVVLVQVVISAVTQGIPTLAPWIRADLGLSLGQVGLLGTAINVGTVLCVATAGWAVDAYGERAVQVLGSVGVGLAAGLFASLPFGALALVPLVLAGMGAAAPTPGGSAAVMGWFPPGLRGLAMGLRQTGIPLGGAVAAALAPPLAEAAGWRAAVIGGAAACVLIGLACWLTYREPPTRRQARGSLGPVRLRSLITRDVALTSVAGGLLPFAQFAIVTYLALYLSQEHGIPVTTGAQLLIAAQLAGVVGRIVWGSASDRLFASRRRPPLIAAGLIATAGTQLLAWLPREVSPVWLTVLAVVLGFSAIGWQGNWVALISELAGPAAQGRTVGLSMTLTYAGVAVGPPMVGFLVDRSGSWTLAWTSLAAVLAVGSLILVPVRERRPPLSRRSAAEN
jgi:MFS family permease